MVSRVKYCAFRAKSNGLRDELVEMYFVRISCMRFDIWVSMDFSREGFSFPEYCSMYYGGYIF